ncbi:CTLH/CRA C-terminal to lish motif domain-containing protein [Tricharina praecox]|uniref:CTLH/CRA C-terminal to lish motif domain-containing protein n=1 Tax=Tricharina praecox TaxID=43433 RepID=UPI002220B69A|nr:CTLH/CRA C-terminal to lish motif domain-containing protein [Tricharina praecox]KAI5848239.1 CTLH/CRA C-terminal to lish motif domain-containing protein [Tricharina praecox]
MASRAAASTRKAYASDFERRVDEVNVSKSHLNHLVMNYLINEGYQKAAMNFAKEAGIQPHADMPAMDERINIRNDIHCGNIQLAIERINCLHPEILDTDPSLHFSLLRLQLIELIRKCTSTPDGDITPALEFATTHLAPRAPGNASFLEDLERTMALLCFPKDNLAPPLAELMDPALRRRVAAQVNETIMEAQGMAKEPKIRSLIKLRAWSEDRARATRKGSELPPLDLGLDIGTVDQPMTS